MRSLLRVVLVLSLYRSIGCADPRFYQIPVNVPFPDEWVAGARSPAEQSIALAKPTIQWHRDLDPDQLARTVDAMLAPSRAVYHYVRIDYASAKRPSRRYPKTIPIVEVKIDATLLPTRHVPARVSQTWVDLPFNEAVKTLIEPLGRDFSIDPNVTAPPAVSADFKSKDPRLVLAEILLAHDLFLEPTASAAQEFRSFEYRSQNEFLSAIRTAARQIETAVPFDAPIVIVPFARWLRDNPEPQRFIWQVDPDKSDAIPKAVPLGLASDPALAKKQFVRTLQDRIK